LFKHKGKPGRAFMSNKEGLSILGEEHEVSLPMARKVSFCGTLRLIVDRDTMFDAQHWTGSFFSSPSSLVFRLRQIMPPRVICCSLNLGIKKTVNRFGANTWSCGEKFKPSADLLRRKPLL